MEIITKHLVLHKYEETEILKNSAPNCLKAPELEYNDNSTHPFAKDIQNSDLAIEIKGDTDTYMYFFITIDVAQMGNKRFKIEKIIIDENLSENCAIEFSKQALTTFINGDFTTKDYIVTDKPYPFYEHSKNEIIPSVIESIIDRFKFEKDGLDSNMGQELLDRLKKRYKQQ